MHTHNYQNHQQGMTYIMSQLTMPPMSGWTVCLNDKGGLDIKSDKGLCLSSEMPTVSFTEGTSVPSGDWKATAGASEDEPVVYTLGKSCTLTLKITKDNCGWLGLNYCLTNNSNDTLYIEDIFVLNNAALRSPVTLDRVFRQGADMCGHCRLEVLEGECDVDAVIGASDAEGNHAFVMGFGDLGNARYSLKANGTTAGGLNAVSAFCQREGTPVSAGQSVTISELLLGESSSMTAMIQHYAKGVGDRMGARRAPKPKTGWCSWYYYYSTESEEDILRDMRNLAKSTVGDKLEVIQLDDGWNLPSNDHPRVWGDWTPGTKFPRGMKALVNDIKEAGFEAGLWLAPFSVDKASNLYRDHQDWLVKGELKDTGLIETADCFGVAALDLTHPEVLDFLRETFDRVFNEWGFDYIKIDFLLHALIRGIRYDNSKTPVEVIRQGLQVIRDVAGDRFVLCCGCPLGAAIGLCDAMRIGMDISSRWYVPMNLAGWPLGNCNVKSGANQTILRQWMQGNWWQNDPDCLLVRDFGSPGEFFEFGRMEGGKFLESPPYGLSEEEAGFWARLVWMMGGMTLIGERVEELSEERMKLLESCFPLCEKPGQLVDWYGDPDVRVFYSSKDKGIIGIFNMGDDEKQVSLPAAKAGANESWAFRERLSGETLEGTGSIINFPPLPAHGGRLWERTQ